MTAAATAFSADFLARNRVEEQRLADKTTFRIGGPATVVRLDDRRDLAEARAVCGRVLGGGANLLVGDEGVAEPVLRLGRDFALIDIGNVQGGVVRVSAGAGAELPRLVATCVRAGVQGFEELAGIPGLVGGAAVMNAGTRTCWLLDRATAVEAWLPGEEAPRQVDRSEIPAGYRDGGLGDGALILSLTWSLPVADPAVLAATAEKTRAAKQAAQPVSARSPGCMFKNPAADLPAGKVLDELGCKGWRVGDAVVSDRHANFILNAGAATARDVCSLVQRLRRHAWRQRRVALHLEVRTWDCPEDLAIHPQELGEEHGPLDR